MLPDVPFLKWFAFFRSLRHLSNTSSPLRIQTMITPWLPPRLTRGVLLSARGSFLFLRFPPFPSFQLHDPQWYRYKCDSAAPELDGLLPSGPLAIFLIFPPPSTLPLKSCGRTSILFVSRIDCLRALLIRLPSRRRICLPSFPPFRI